MHVRLLIDRGKIDEAEPFIKVVHDFTHQKTMPGNYRIGLADSLKGAWHWLKHQPDAAEPLLVAGVANLRKSRGDHHWLT